MDISFVPRIKNERCDDSQNSMENEDGVKKEQIDDHSGVPDTKITQEVCRLCGRMSSDYTPIFDNDNLFIAEKISRCLPIVVLSTDDLPLYVCSNCLQSLNTCYKLIVTSLKVDSRLRRRLTKCRQKSDSPSCTNDYGNFPLSDKFNSDDIHGATTERLNFKVMYGPMECEMCTKKFVDMNEFDRHIETDHLLPWPCSLCDKSFETSEKLVAHKEATHAGNVLICTGCIDAERLAHGLSSLAEMQNSRKRVIKAKRSRLKVPKKCVEHIPNAGIEKIKKIPDKKKTDTMLLAMCDICKIAFGTDELLAAHRRVHQKKILRCYICQIDTTSIYELFIHKRETHNVYKRVQLKFVCDTCGKFFSNNWQWLNHQQKINCKRRASSYTCKYCESNFTTNCKLTRHLRKHKDEMLKDPSATIYRCVACPKIFVDKEFYQKHRNVHDPECWDKFKCGPCNRSFRDKRRLREHQQSIHEGVKPHQCDVCGKMFHRLSNMRVHRKKHFGHKCNHCDEVFEKLRPLANHIKDVHNLEPNFKLATKKQYNSGCFVCRYCGKKLASYQSVLDHEHIHTGEKPYACKICDKSFRSYTSRWAHAQRHVKGIFICEHCGKSFSYKQNLTTHMQVHVPMESRRHRCSKCGKLFQRKSHLNVHMRIHDGVRPYTCDICQFSFTQLGDMRRHRARHANGEIRLRQPRTKAVRASSNGEDVN